MFQLRFGLKSEICCCRQPFSSSVPPIPPPPSSSHDFHDYKAHKVKKQLGSQYRWRYVAIGLTLLCMLLLALISYFIGLLCEFVYVCFILTLLCGIV